MIRFLHTSDWHLGRDLFGRSLLEDQSFALEQLLHLIDRLKPHALLIAGDVFDRATPPESAVSLFDRFLLEAAGRRELPVLMIPGNHDSCERLGFASRLLRDRGVTIFARLEDAFRPVVIKGDGGTEMLVHGIPFSEPAAISRFLERDDLVTPDLATGALCRAILERKTCARPAVLLCHAFVVGAQTSESEREIYIGGSSQVDARAFDGFSYAALGHLHRPQTAGGDRVRYSGSLLSYSKSEIGHDKAVLEVSLDPASGAANVSPHRLPKLRDLRFVEGELDALIARATDERAGREDYVIASLTDAGLVLDARAKLRKVYPNLVHVGRTEGYVPLEAPSLARLKERERMSELDLFGEFLRESTGAEMTELEREIVAQSLAAIERREREA